MSKVCALSGQKRSVGYNVSHSNRHTKRTFLPNVNKRTIVDPFTGEKITAKISSRSLRTLTKNPSVFKSELKALVKKKQRVIAKNIKK